LLLFVHLAPDILSTYSLILDVVLSCYSHLLGIGMSKFFSGYQV
jgi:hypothetical protein